MATGDLTLVDQILHVELSDGNIVKVGSTVKSKNNDLITPAGLTMKWIINDIIVSAQNRVRVTGTPTTNTVNSPFINVNLLVRVTY